MGSSPQGSDLERAAIEVYLTFANLDEAWRSVADGCEDAASRRVACEACVEAWRGPVSARLNALLHGITLAFLLSPLQEPAMDATVRRRLQAASDAGARPPDRGITDASTPLDVLLRELTRVPSAAEGGTGSAPR